MKKISSLLLLTLILCLSSCSIWENKWDDIRDLPGIEDQIEVDPWESTDDNRDLY